MLLPRYVAWKLSGQELKHLRPWRHFVLQFRDALMHGSDLSCNTCIYKKNLPISDSKFSSLRRWILWDITRLNEFAGAHVEFYLVCSSLTVPIRVSMVSQLSPTPVISHNKFLGIVKSFNLASELEWLHYLQHILSEISLKRIQPSLVKLSLISINSSWVISTTFEFDLRSHCGHKLGNHNPCASLVNSQQATHALMSESLMW